MNASVHGAFQIPVGALTLTVPELSRVPGLMWGNLSLAAVLESQGYDVLAQQTISRLEAWLRKPDPVAALAWPGEGAEKTGHKLTDGLNPGDDALTWYVIRTATRQEKAAENGLIEAGMAVYVPRMARWRRHARKKTRIERPLFVGYMFVGLAEGQSLYHVTAVEGVHAVVRFSGSETPRPVPFKGERSISAFLDLELAGEFDKTRKSKRKDPEPGAPVKVVGGMFQGFPAKFEALRDDERVDLLLQMFGRWTPALLKRDEVLEFRDED